MNSSSGSMIGMNARGSNSPTRSGWFLNLALPTPGVLRRHREAGRDLFTDSWKGRSRNTGADPRPSVRHPQELPLLVENDEDPDFSGIRSSTYAPFVFTGPGLKSPLSKGTLTVSEFGFRWSQALVPR